MALLRSIVDSAVLRNRAHFVVLSGDAGVGKSRLAGEIASYAAQASPTTRVLGGQCVPYGADVWWPIAEAIPRRVRTRCRRQPRRPHARS